MNRIFSGIQPTGNLHLGNYLGAIRNWVALQRTSSASSASSICTPSPSGKIRAKLSRNTRKIAAACWLRASTPKARDLQPEPGRGARSAGLDLQLRGPLGWLNRMTQFKEKAGKHKENASVGLYAYPNLMAADILAYKATHVPVGEDQKQHLELARDIAQKFNADFGVALFPAPEPLIFGPATRVMSLRTGRRR